MLRPCSLPMKFVNVSMVVIECMVYTCMCAAHTFIDASMICMSACTIE